MITPPAQVSTAHPLGFLTVLILFQAAHLPIAERGTRDEDRGGSLEGSQQSGLVQTLHSVDDIWALFIARLVHLALIPNRLDLSKGFRCRYREDGYEDMTTNTKESRRACRSQHYGMQNDIARHSNRAYIAVLYVPINRDRTCDINILEEHLEHLTEH